MDSTAVTVEGRSSNYSRDGEEDNCWKSCAIISVIFVIITICTSGLLQAILFDGNDCGSQLKYGYWTRSGGWQTHRCIIHRFKMEEVGDCIKGWDKIVFMGDDQAQEHYKTFSAVNNQCKFLLHPTLSKSVLDTYEHIAREMKGESSLLVMHQPNALEMTEEPKVLKEELQSVRRAQEALLKRAGKCKVLIVLSADATYNPRNERELMTVAKQVFANVSAAGVVLIELAAPSGKEVATPISEDLNIILNSFCNSPLNSSCCVNHQDDWASYLAHSLVIAILAIYFGFYLVFASGATFALTPYLEAKGVNLDRFFLYLHGVGTVTGVVLYLQMCTSLRYFADTNLPQDTVTLCASLVILVSVALATVTKTDNVETLSQSQCNEWRGWVVLLVVVFHWTGYQQESLGLIVDRLFEGSMVFLTGYCNYLSQCQKAGRSGARDVVWGLVRLNFVPVLVSHAVGSSYLSYYLAPVLSLGYLFTAMFVRIGPATTSSGGKHSSAFGKRSKLQFMLKLVLSLFLFLSIPYIEHVIIGVFSGVQWSSVFVTDITKVYETIEISKWLLLFGVALGYVSSLVKENSPSWSRTLKNHLKLAVVASGILLLIMFLVDTRMTLSQHYHHLPAIIPILCYAVLRNGSETARGYSSLFLQEAGALSMWLYVAHYHILITYRGRGILVLMPGAPFINNLLVLMVYLLITNVLYRQLPLINSDASSDHLMLN